MFTWRWPKHCFSCVKRFCLFGRMCKAGPEANLFVNPLPSNLLRDESSGGTSKRFWCSMEEVEYFSLERTDDKR